MLDIILGVKQYADYENMIGRWISRRLGVIPITSIPYGLLMTEILTFSVVWSWVSPVMSSEVSLGSVRLGWIGFG